jgi:hypothetical protein
VALFAVGEGRLHPIQPGSFAAEGWRERDHLQRYLRDQPDVLEPGLFVLAEEFSSWADSNRRIDLLALDAEGHLAVVELKLDDSAAMELQAIRYAAMVANMTFEQAVETHTEFLRRRGIKEDARTRVAAHLGLESDIDPELSSARPRILLAAADFSRELTTTVLWLNDAGLDITCLRVRPYRLGTQLFLSIEQVIPLPEAQDYVLQLREKAAEAESTRYPDVPWTLEDFRRLSSEARHAGVRAVLNECSARSNQWVALSEILSGSELSHPQLRAALAGLTQIVKRRFGRSNWPFESALGRGW